MSLKIVLDSSVLFGHWFLSGPNFTVLERHLDLRLSQLFVPEVVVLETANNYRNRLAAGLSDLRKLGALLPDVEPPLSTIELETQVEAYERQLRARFEDLSANVLAADDIPHDALISRAIDKRRPFGAKKGHRDALIWECIVRHVADDTNTTVLVTANQRDFADPKKVPQVHPDLAADLDLAEIPRGAVIISPSFRDLIDDHITPQLDKAPGAIAEDPDWNTRVLAWMRAAEDLLVGLEVAQIHSALQVDIDGPTISHVEAVALDEIEDAVSVDEDSVVITATGTAEATIDFFVPKFDAASASVHAGVQIEEWDWNRHYAWAQLTTVLPVRFELTVSLGELRVGDVEATVPEFFGLCRKCGAAIISDAAEGCWACETSFF